MKTLLLFSISVFSLNALPIPDLIGGRAATPEEFRSTVSIPGNCTASKIAERTFILAAHCVMDSNNGEIRKNWRPGNLIQIRTHYQFLRNLVLEGVHPHETYVLGLKARIDGKLPRAGVGLEAFDVAVFNVTDLTPEIPVAEIATEWVQAGEKVIIGGWGCEERSGGYYDYSKAHYKIAESYVVEGGSVKSDYHRRDISKVDAFNFLSQGLRLNDGAASICPGDSGGPVYREVDGALIGVNTQYIFSDASGVSLVNTHGRLSEIIDWIKAYLY